MLFLTPNQQRQSAESTRTFLKDIPQKYSKTDAELVAIRKTSGQRVLTKGCIAEGAPKISPSPEGFLVPCTEYTVRGAHELTFRMET